MRIGLSSATVGTGSLDDVVAEARRAASDGYASFWVAQVFGLDALTALTVVGREVPGIELGTAVVPTYPRHPWVMAQQALTTQVAVGGRLTLGVGLSHQVVIEGMWGISFAKPVLHLREYLEVLVPLSKGEAVSLAGRTVSAHGSLTVPNATPFSVLVAALGPQMLEVTGRLADGTITWCVGPKTLSQHTIPVLAKAAEEAGRAIPRVIAMLPFGVRDDLEAAHERMTRIFRMYGTLPSYRAMLDREGVEGPADIAIVGNEDQIAERVAALRDIGVTDLMAVGVGGSPDELERTKALLPQLQQLVG
jgi:F420-dependent oxidoreductase-like protein